jgi:hypothetical protein
MVQAAVAQEHLPVIGPPGTAKMMFDTHGRLFHLGTESRAVHGLSPA